MPACPAMLMGGDAGNSFLGKAIHPVVERIRPPRPQQPLPGHRMGALALGDLQQGPAALANVGSWIVVPELPQLRTLLRSQR